MVFPTARLSHERNCGSRWFCSGSSALRRLAGLDVLPLWEPLLAGCCRYCPARAGRGLRLCAVPRLLSKAMPIDSRPTTVRVVKADGPDPDDGKEHSEPDHCVHFTEDTADLSTACRGTTMAGQIGFLRIVAKNSASTRRWCGARKDPA